MKQHYKCWIWKALWILSLASFVVALVGAYGRQAVFGLEPLAWFWNALVLGVLAVPVKLDCHNCGVCQVPKSEM